MDDKERIEKLCAKLQKAFAKPERVLAIIQTRDESLEALCDSVSWHHGTTKQLSIRMQCGEMRLADLYALYADRNCYAYIESEPQVVFKFPEKPEGMPLNIQVDAEGFVDSTTEYEFFLELP